MEQSDILEGRRRQMKGLQEIKSRPASADFEQSENICYKKPQTDGLRLFRLLAEATVKVWEKGGSLGRHHLSSFLFDTAYGLWYSEGNRKNGRMNE